MSNKIHLTIAWAGSNFTLLDRIKHSYKCSRSICSVMSLVYFVVVLKCCYYWDLIHCFGIGVNLNHVNNICVQDITSDLLQSKECT